MGSDWADPTMWAKDRELPIPKENKAFQKQEKFSETRNISKKSRQFT